MAGGPGLVKKIDEFLDFASAKSTAASGECVQKKRAEYARLREEVVGYEKSMGFEYACTTNASDDEKRANKILQDLRKADITNVYDKAAGRVGYHGQVHRRFYGDHFLSNVKLIEQTQVFRLLRAMPKGAHLHIHFNANLHPLFLLNVAKTMDRMFVWSDKPLVREGCQLDPEAMNSCRLQFRIMDEKAAEGAGKGNMLSPQYRGGTVMRFQDLVNQLVARYSGTNNPSEEKKREAMTQIDRWLHDKVVFHEEEAHNSLQTAQGLVDPMIFVRLTRDIHTDTPSQSLGKVQREDPVHEGALQLRNGLQEVHAEVSGGFRRRQHPVRRDPAQLHVDESGVEGRRLGPDR